MCYWADGYHPRSFYARWVWLGLRNRASHLSQTLGTDIQGTPEIWEGPTWKVTKVGDKYRYFELLQFLGVISLMHCVYKVPVKQGETREDVVSIGYSLRKK